MAGPEFAAGVPAEGVRTGATPHDAARPTSPAALLVRLWWQNAPILRERIADLEAAAREATEGVLSEKRRTQASDIAHKLAGSLGMFGYPRGTDLARELEQMLEAATPVNAARFVELAAQLRSSLPLYPAAE